MRPSLPPTTVWSADSPILLAVQTANVFTDSKDFVDSPLLVDAEEAWQRFADLPQPPDNAAIQAFVTSTFGPPGGMLDEWTPPDHQAAPPLLGKLPAAASEWASALNNLWPQLGRRTSSAVVEHPERTTLLPCAHGLIVPGGRFREAYYWDSYWVVLGLLACGMRSTAEGVTRNLLDAATKHGFVPNGLRSYYLNRSQPPLLTQMVAALVDSSATPADVRRTLLRDALPVLDEEYRWWMRGGDSGSAVVLPERSAGEPATLNRYVVAAAAPRVESYGEDAATAAGLPEADRAQCYADLAAAAESGWDFSSRWLSDSWTFDTDEGGQRAASSGSAPRLASIRTSAVAPVELNAILHRNEATLQRLHSSLAEMLRSEGSEASAAAEHAAAAERYGLAAAARRGAMDAWMWDARTRRWHDVEWHTGRRLQQESAASYMPLWAGAHDAAQAAAAVAALGESGLLQPGGVATTLVNSGEQWDAPNAWPPLQQMLMEGLRTCGAPSAPALAETLATRWLRSNWLGWNATGQMHEKYDASRPGERGAGGEYLPQVGFGWTNGVALWTLETFAETAVVSSAVGVDAETCKNQ